jgi:hypothetical protein
MNGVIAIELAAGVCKVVYEPHENHGPRREASVKKSGALPAQYLSYHRQSFSGEAECPLVLRLFRDYDHRGEYERL